MLDVCHAGEESGLFYYHFKRDVGVVLVEILRFQPNILWRLFPDGESHPQLKEDLQRKTRSECEEAYPQLSGLTAAQRHNLLQQGAKILQILENENSIEPSSEIKTDDVLEALIAARKTERS